MIARKRDIKAINQQFTHLKNFMTPIPARNFSPAGDKGGQNSLVVMGESDEAVNHLLNVQLGDIFSAYAHEYLIDLHISDQKVYNNYPLWLKASLYIPDTSNADKVKDCAKLIRAIFLLVDRVVTLRLSPAARQKAEKPRKAIERIKAKEKAEENED